jgi:hypothetical protein
MATSTIVVPDNHVMRNYPPALAREIVAVATAAKADIEGLTAASLSAADPANVGAVADDGAAATASKSDHVHADPNRAAAGTNVADSDNTIAVGAGLWRKMPTVTGNRSITLGTTGAAAGDQMTVTRTSTAANTVVFINGGSGAGTLYTMPASKVAFARFQFDGVDWSLRECGVGS